MEAETPPVLTTEENKSDVVATKEEFVDAQSTHSDENSSTLTHNEKQEDIPIPLVPTDEVNPKTQCCVDEDDLNSTIHGFNDFNITVIEKTESSKSKLNLNLKMDCAAKQVIGDGSDSGVEVCGLNDNVLLRALSSNSGGYASSYGLEDCTPAQSCDSSLISCCSTYEDAYDVLARRNSTLLEDLKLNHCEGTSEGGSESSSVTGSSSSRPSKRMAINVKKKVNVNEPTKTERNVCSTPTSSKFRSRPPNPRMTPKTPTMQDRSKSKERNPKPLVPPRPNTVKPPMTPRPKTIPDKAAIESAKKEAATRRRAASSTRAKTPLATPTDDGRWPSTNSAKSNTTPRSVRGGSVTSDINLNRSRVQQMTTEQKNSVIEKYATLPRRRKEKSADSIKDLQKSQSREPSVNRAANLRKQLIRDVPSGRSLPPYPRKKPVGKTKIYHEANVQTLLTCTDVEQALAGVGIRPVNPYDVETTEKEIQVDLKHEKVDQLEAQLKALTEKHNKLSNESKEQKEKIASLEQVLAVERVEKQALKDELESNMHRIQTILGNEDGTMHQDENNDSFMVLESRFQKARQVIIKQENEISELHSFCRQLQKDLEKSLAAQKILLQQQQDLEAEGIELQEFMSAEKNTLTEALHETESKIKSFQMSIIQRDEEIEQQRDEYKILTRINEQRRQENLSLQARMGALESRSRDLLLQQGAAVSGTALALSGLTSRIDVFVEQLIMSYNISDKDLEDVIFHNEAYSNSNSSDEGSPDRSKKRSPSPKKGSSFVSAIISAIKNAAAQTPFAHVSKNSIDDHSDSTEMLDSETEPCLMMENVLEDVSVPDGHSVNMISSTHSLFKSGMLGRSESLHNLPHSIFNRQNSDTNNMCESMYGSYSDNMISLSEICPAVTLVDQVIEADNLLTKLLKVLRIIQLENDNCINELQEERSELVEKLSKQRETNELAAQQLKDWETLGARLKSELQEVMQQLTNKSHEVEELKTDLQNHRQQIERLNQDVCELSTACSKAEMKLRSQEEEALTALKEWQESGQMPSAEVLSKLVAGKDEMPTLKEKLIEKEKHLDELVQEFQASRQVMSENWNQAVNEARKQYEAIDTALETLHSIQSVVQQCPPLAKLQRDLEETSFQCASSMPFVAPDLNANAAMLKAFANLSLATTQATAINSTA